MAFGLGLSVAFGGCGFRSSLSFGRNFGSGLSRRLQHLPAKKSPGCARSQQYDAATNAHQQLASTILGFGIFGLLFHGHS